LPFRHRPPRAVMGPARGPRPCKLQAHPPCFASFAGT
jgi:hypothetical protein